LNGLLGKDRVATTTEELDLLFLVSRHGLLSGEYKTPDGTSVATAVSVEYDVDIVDAKHWRLLKNVTVGIEPEGRIAVDERVRKAGSHSTLPPISMIAAEVDLWLRSSVQ
jgi:hypothetical protein